MKPTYRSVYSILYNEIVSPYRSACLKILEDNEKLFRTVQGSTHNHQAWPGGYYDHVQEVLNDALVIYDAFRLIRPWPFSLSDGLVALFFHDIEKPWKYNLGEDGQWHIKPELVSKKAQHEFKMKKIREYEIELTPEIEHAIKYTEGELNDYTSKRRVMSPLAAFCHMCDVYSARIGFNHPLSENDPWPGAQRNKS